MECKSGYGLSVDSELKLLEVNQLLSELTQMSLHSTLIHIQLPAVVEQGFASYADVFCEPGWFSLEDTELIVKAASELGLASRLHVDEFVDGGGLALASELGAISGDHVGHSSASARQSASESGVMQTFLPGTPYILGHDLESPLKQCIDCRTLSIPFVGSLATHRLGLSPIEALVAVTRNPATTLLNSTDGPLSGSIRQGGPADLLILDSEYIDAWCQMPGDNPIYKTIKSGYIVNQQ